MQRKHIYIAYNGGTIGMRPTAQGYAPEPGYLAEQLAAMPEFQHPLMPSYTLHEYQPLLDSANMHPDDWYALAQDIAAHYDAYDGFVVLHGTDTLAYTASALPFMLQGLAKPVILTGSQIPLCEVRSDARENLVTSLLIAAHHPVPEVCLYFGGRLLRGCRATKIDALGFQAFDSPNHPWLGTIGTEIDIHWEHIRPAGNGPLALQALNRATAGALRLFPGISASVLYNLLQPPLQGLVLEAYGMGNGPVRDPEFMVVLRQACERGIVIVDVSQCLKGKVDLGGYTTGSELAAAGVISGGDMTAEAALAKLHYLFSAGYAPDEVRARMTENLCGELTYDDTPH